jgi:hypothetical protein
MRTVAAVLALVACVHAGLWLLLRSEQNPPNFSGKLESVSLAFAPSVDSAYPGRAQRPTPEQVRADLAALAPYTKAVRLYSSTGGAELVPPIAAEFGLKVTVGAWLQDDKERNDREIRAALDLARHNNNVNAIVVGNETTLRAEMSVDDLIQLIHKVRIQSPVPVTTGEIWTVWIDHPELASAVDFIAAHILPYWEGFDASHAVQFSPVVTGTGLDLFTCWMNLMRSSAVTSLRSMASLPTTIAFTLLLCRARSSAERISRSLRSWFLSIQAPTVTFSPNSAAIGGTSSAPPVEE